MLIVARLNSPQKVPWVDIAANLMGNVFPLVGPFL
jgi:hypothetical protein